MSTDPPKTSWKREAPFRLGDLEVLPASGELRGRRGVERLRPLLMDILLRLAAEPGEVVRRETLLEDVWPRRMVNDEVLSRAIAELRTALGDDPRVARYIETLPKLGYRLVAPVEPLTPAAPVPPPATPQAAPAKRVGPWPWWVGVAAALLALGAWWLAHRTAPAPGAGLEARLLSARPFTSDPVLELSPRFSPDGRRVVFSLAEAGGSRVAVQDLDGAARQLVGGERDGVSRLGPVFFPDGRRIAYWRATLTGCAIVEHDLASGAERSVLDCTRQPRSRFDLSADGRWLVFAAPTRPQFPSGLWLLEIDRGTPTALTTPQPGEGEDLFPRFSPDGKRVAFFRGGESHRQPWIVERGDGTTARALAKIDGLAYGLAWLGPDGPLLASADWFGFRALNLVDIARGTARLAGARGARFPDIGPRGEVVYENAVYSSNLWPLDLRTGQAAAAPRWRSTRYSSQPEVSPDGMRVAFASNRDGADAIYVAPMEGEARRIAFGDAYRYMRPHWSADGRTVYAVRTTTDAAGVTIQEGVRIPADGSTAQVIAELGRAVNDVREGGDGKLYWAELSGQAMRLLRAPMESLSGSERLPVPLVSQYQVQGGRLAFTQPQLTTLTLCQLDTLACEPTTLAVAEPDTFHWSLAARSIYLRSRAEGEARLARYDIASRRIAQTWPFPPTGTGSSIAATPAEDMLLVAREEGPAIDLMLAR